MWYSTFSFAIDLNLTDTNSHQIALYLLDWTNAGYVESIKIVDVATGATLDTQSASQFSAGVYEVWNITGHVKIEINKTTGFGVVSGLFFK